MSENKERKQITIDDAKAREALTALVEKFESGDIAPMVAKAMLSPKDSGRPVDGWSLGNQLVTWLFGQTADARTFKAWQTVGRQVRKGSKAFSILRPVKKFAGVITEIDPVTKKETERKIFRIVNVAPTPRFRIEDTDIADADLWEANEPKGFEPENAPNLIGVAEAWNVEVKWSGSGHVFGAYGMTDGETRISMFTQDEQTFCHELSHVAHAKVLAGRQEKMVVGQDSKQEAVAELSAAALMSMFGEANEGYSFNYIERYAKDGDAISLIHAVLADVEKVLSLIVATANGEEVEEWKGGEAKAEQVARAA